MSVASYLMPGRPESRKKKTEGKDARWPAAWTERGVPVRRPRDEDEFYGGVDSYDPVLRAHCRVEP